MQRGKSCSPNDAKPQRTFPLQKMPFVSIRYVQPLKHSFGAIASQSTKVAITIRLGMGQGQRTTMEATMYNTSPG